MKNRPNTCYMCDELAESQEHVPPKCLFPEQKDTKSFNLRKNLIKVPSCSIHNSSKSDDDEFLMIFLSGIISNNQIGELQYLTKANRAIRRKSKDFLEKQILRNRKSLKIKISENEFSTIIIGNPNIDRLTNCFKHIGYGLYYHEYKKKFEGEIKIHFGFLKYGLKNDQELNNYIKERFDIEKKLKLSIKGENPEVFTYEFQKPDQFDFFSVKLVFYGKTDIYIAFKPKNSPVPFSIPFQMMKDGHKTIFSLGEKKIEFN